MIRSGKPGVFIVGADIREFLAEHRRAESSDRRDVRAAAGKLFRAAVEDAVRHRHGASTGSASAAAPSWRCGAIAA